MLLNAAARPLVRTLQLLQLELELTKLTRGQGVAGGWSSGLHKHHGRSRGRQVKSAAAAAHAVPIACFMHAMLLLVPGCLPRRLGGIPVPWGMRSTPPPCGTLRKICRQQVVSNLLQSSTGSIWIFGYGSLVHRPGFEHARRVEG